MSSAATTDNAGEASLDVRLEAVAGERPEAADEPRNPFRFGVTPSPSGFDSGASRPAARGEPPPSPPSGTTAPPPPRGGGGTSLTFIGLLDAPESAGRVAVLTDGADVVHGRVGDIIVGRYRVVSIDAKSVELEYLQGGGRQTLRLNGS